MIGPGAAAMAVTAVLHDGLVSSLERAWNGPRERTLVEVLRRTDFALLHVGVLANPPCKGGKAGPKPTKPASVCRYNSLMFTAWWSRCLSCIHRGHPM